LGGHFPLPGKPKARASPQRAGLFLSGGFALSIDLRLSVGSEAAPNSLSPQVVDHETAHDRAERQAASVRPAIGSLRRFDFEHEGKKRPVGRADQPPLVLRLAEFGNEGNEGAVRVCAKRLSTVPGLSPALYAR
jgi:hypothetical protein